MRTTISDGFLQTSATRPTPDQLTRSCIRKKTQHWKHGQLSSSTGKTQTPQHKSNSQAHHKQPGEPLEPQRIGISARSPLDLEPPRNLALGEPLGLGGRLVPEREDAALPPGEQTEQRCFDTAIIIRLKLRVPEPALERSLRG